MFLILILFSLFNLNLSKRLPEEELDLDNILKWTFRQPYEIKLLNINKVKPLPEGQEFPKHPSADFFSVSVSLDEAFQIYKCINTGTASLEEMELLEKKTLVFNTLTIPLDCFVKIKFDSYVGGIDIYGNDTYFISGVKYRPYRLYSKLGHKMLDETEFTTTSFNTNIRLKNDLSVWTDFDIECQLSGKVHHTIINLNRYSMLLSEALNMNSLQSDVHIPASSPNILFQKKISLKPGSNTHLNVEIVRTALAKLYDQEATITGYIAFFVLGKIENSYIWFIPFSEFSKLLPMYFKTNNDDSNSASFNLKGILKTVSHKASLVKI